MIFLTMLFTCHGDTSGMDLTAASTESASITMAASVDCGAGPGYLKSSSATVVSLAPPLPAAARA
ncbi:MAG: hypothetical protein BWY85_01635 [Firmicutes bacterium ADurb.Bin506]|nr:MAG: hypothetical protein BWY85_01635 [Firmicutes bacterium ADurb.Bin506]